MRAAFRRAPGYRDAGLNMYSAVTSAIRAWRDLKYAALFVLLSGSLLSAPAWATVALSKKTLEETEGSSATYTVHLNLRVSSGPTSNVTVTIDRSNEFGSNDTVWLWLMLLSPLWMMTIRMRLLRRRLRP